MPKGVADDLVDRGRGRARPPLGAAGPRRRRPPRTHSARPQDATGPCHTVGRSGVRLVEPDEGGHMHDADGLAERFDDQAPRPPAEPWPTGCWGRSPRPRTPSRTPGCAWAGADADAVENLGGWLITVVARICLNRLRARTVRREEPLDTHASLTPWWRTCGGSGPRTRPWWPTRWDWRSSWCSTRSTRRSASPSCCTTCSTCPSRTSPPCAAHPGGHPPARQPGQRRVRGAAVPETEPTWPPARRGRRLLGRRAGRRLRRALAVLDPDVVMRIDAGTRRSRRQSAGPRPWPASPSRPEDVALDPAARLVPRW